ncbi:uncharacterized protein FPRN_14256 [Fusarium proliferatum]|nr:uncharacterized protein FPRN_14256 [Fusarium proliferatum]
MTENNINKTDHFRCTGTPSTETMSLTSLSPDMPPEDPHLIESERFYETEGSLSKLTSLFLGYEDYVRLLAKLRATYARRELITVRVPSRLHETCGLSVSNVKFDAIRGSAIAIITCFPCSAESFSNNGTEPRMLTLKLYSP